MRITACVLLCIATSAYAETPTDRAKAFVTSQLAAVTKGDTKAFQAMFGADAYVESYSPNEPLSKHELYDLADPFMSGSPHNEFKKIKLEKLVAGGDANVVWFTGDISTTYAEHEPEQDDNRSNAVAKTRFTELIVLDGSTWKAVAASLVSPRETSRSIHPEHSMLKDATAPGPLAPLAASPADLIKKLSTDKNVFVLGTDKNERAIGPAAAKKLLGRWAKLKMTFDEKSIREVETKTYAFAEVSVTYTTSETTKLTVAPWKKTETIYHPMTALIIAVPKGDDWSVVGIHYSND